MLFIVVISLLAGCAQKDVEPLDVNGAQLANPSALYCDGLGYSYEIVTAADGGQSGVCKFSEGAECPGWEFFRGECGNEYSYCEAQGGELVTRSGEESFTTVQAVCILPGGGECPEWDYFKGVCP